MYYKVFKYVLVLLCISPFVVSCGDSIGGDSKSPVMLVISAETAAYAVGCDVYNSGNPPLDDLIKVDLRSVYKNQTKPPSTAFADIILEEYRVQYYRSDGKTDVPKPFTHACQSRVPQGGTLSLEILVVRASAKLESPLKELALGGGEGQIFFNAVVKFFGEDLAGNAVSEKIVVPVIAKDW